MNVTLINNNRYLSPPVVPTGLEYLVAPFEEAGHHVSILHLSFSEDPPGDIVTFLESSRPDIIGFPVRNIDTSIFGNDINTKSSRRRLP